MILSINSMLDFYRFLGCNGETIQASPWIHPFGHQPFLLGDIPMKHTQRLRFLEGRKGSNG